MEWAGRLFENQIGTSGEAGIAHIILNEQSLPRDVASMYRADGSAAAATSGQPALAPRFTIGDDLDASSDFADSLELERELELQLDVLDADMDLDADEPLSAEPEPSTHHHHRDSFGGVSAAVAEYAYASSGSGSAATGVDINTHEHTLSTSSTHGANDTNGDTGGASQKVDRRARRPRDRSSVSSHASTEEAASNATSGP